MSKKPTQFLLIAKLDKYYLKYPKSTKEKPVNIVRLRPFHPEDSGISITNNKKEELIYLENIKDTSVNNQKIIKKALQERTFLPSIISIKSIKITHGVRYWNTITNIGPKIFAMIKPSSHITFITKDKIAIRDTFNNYYQIESIAKLDPKSKQELTKII